MNMESKLTKINCSIIGQKQNKSIHEFHGKYMIMIVIYKEEGEENSDETKDDNRDDDDDDDIYIDYLGRHLKFSCFY